MIADIRDEFIGEKILILMSKNSSLSGMSGTIVDETKSSFVIETDNVDKTHDHKGFKRVLKQGSIFRIGGLNVEGDEISKRPEDRIKLKIKVRK